MRTTECHGIQRVEISRLEPPMPEVYIVYDGLGGLSERFILRDVLNELARFHPEGLRAFLDAVRKCRRAAFSVYFRDFVSYGVGGGDSTSEFFFGTFPIFLATEGDRELEREKGPALVLMRRDGMERVAFEKAATPTVEPLPEPSPPSSTSA